MSVVGHLGLSQGRKIGRDWEGGAGRRSDETVVTTGSTATVKKSNVSGMAARENEPPRRGYPSMERFVAAQDALMLQILQDNSALLVTIVRQAVLGAQDLSESQITEQFRSAIGAAPPPAVVGAGNAAAGGDDVSSISAEQQLQQPEADPSGLAATAAATGAGNPPQAEADANSLPAAAAEGSVASFAADGSASEPPNIDNFLPLVPSKDSSSVQNLEPLPFAQNPVAGRVNDSDDTGSESKDKKPKAKRHKTN